MIRSIQTLLATLFVSLVLANAAFSAIELKEFKSAEDEKDYRELIFELRCLVCQNQNLADSNADLAIDLRRQTYEMIQDGASKQDVVDYMVERYGEFVLYRPPFTASTLLLWVGPFIILIGAMIILIRMIKSKKQEPDVTMSEEEQEKVRSLLDDK